MRFPAFAALAVAVCVCSLAAAPQASEPGHMEGRVVDRNGVPVSGVTVVLREATSYGQSVASASTNTSGVFSLEVERPGTYGLELKYRSTAQGYGYGQSATYELKAGQTIRDIALTLHPPTSLSGRVLDQEEKPVANVEVRALLSTYYRGHKDLQARLNPVRTDARGEYRLTEIAPGRYYIVAEPDQKTGQPKPGAMSDVLTLYPGSRTLAGAATVRVTPGAQLERMDIHLRRERLARIAGEVTRNDLPADARITVRQLGSSVSPVQRSADSKNGAFSFDGLPPDRYEVTASMAGNGEVHQYRVRSEITLNGADATDLRLALTPAPEEVNLTGVFRVEGTTVTEYAKTAPPRREPDDAYEAGFMAAGRSFAYEQADAQDPNARRKKMGAAEKDEETALLVEEDASSKAPVIAISGDALKRAMDPLAGGFRPMLSLVPESAPATKGGFLAAMRADGSFSVTPHRPLEPGRYLWEVLDLPETLYVKTVLCDGLDSTRLPVYVQSGSRLEIILSDRAGMVTGVLRDGDNKPLEGVAVSVWPTAAVPEGAPSQARVVTTGKDGGFKVSGLAPGDYYVAAWEGEGRGSRLAYVTAFLAMFRAQAAQVTVSEGASARVEPKLIPASKIAEVDAALP